MRSLEYFALGSIVALACFIAAIWVVRVPFYAEPDELAHVDYVFQLFDVGHGFRLSTYHPHTEVAPQTRYLVRVLDYRKMRYNPMARVPSDYGTATYFRRIDSAAPRPSRKTPASGDAAPYVMFVYPPAYYVIEAAILSAAYHVTGSIIVGFFSIRGFNVLLLCGTLIMSYGSLRALGLQRGSSLLAVLAIGTFPLSSIVGSYVQPDNATALLIASIVFAIARGRNDASWRYEAIAMLAVGLLFFVKQHYAVAAWLATVMCLFARGSKQRLSLPSRISICAAPLVLFAISYGYFNPVSGLESPLHFISRTRSTLPAPAFTFEEVSRLTADAIVQCCSGGVFRGFWLGFGIRSAHIFEHDWIAPVLGVIVTCACAAIFVAEWSVLRRLGLIAGARGLRSAARLLVAGHPINLYAVTTAVLFSAHVLSGGVLRLEGRYWLPLLLPLVIVMLVLVPRPVAPRLRPAITFGIAAAMAGYSAVASVEALRAMNADFYGPSTLPIQETVAGIIDMRARDGFSLNTGELRLRESQSVRVSGYAIDMSTGRAATHIYAEIDRRARVPASTVGLPYPPVSNVYTDDAVAATRFVIDIPARELPSGRHHLRFFVGDASQRATPFRDGALITISAAGARAVGD